MEENTRQIIRKLTAQLQQINYEQLPISDYNKRYISNLKPALSYYMQIYITCLQQGSQATGLPVTEINLIDYGGGSGFLSMLAKQIGFRKVIYIDLNPSSVETIQLLKEKTGIGPDVILQGDSDTLASWCKEQNFIPQLLVATDLIEHVYNLSTFFSDLFSINSNMQWVFTTASTPYNPYVKWKLHRLMTACEKEYYTLRYQYIQKHFPALSDNETATAAQKTRGLIYSDIQQAVESNTYPPLTDAFNTCDPHTGNWTERILPMQNYRTLAHAHQYKVLVKKGFYNTERPNLIFKQLCKWLNKGIRLTGKMGFWLAPFIILHFQKK